MSHNDVSKNLKPPSNIKTWTAGSENNRKSPSKLLCLVNLLFSWVIRSMGKKSGDCFLTRQMAILVPSKQWKTTKYTTIMDN